MLPKPAVSPVNNISPVTPMHAIADTAEELNFRFDQLNLAQLSKGQQYQGRVMARLDDQSFLVALNGSALKMSLGTTTQVGEFISLRYMGGFPTPTFLLSPPLPSLSSTSISDSAQLINQYLTSGENKKNAARFEAQSPITSSPYHPASRIAGDLRQALAMSGLFYEAHLAEYVAGKRPLSAILQEPQNQPASTLTALVPQQLHILEQQRLLWHGEVWPRQLMEWEIEQKQKGRDESQASAENADDAVINSRITLHLPRLGKVTAKIACANGHMRIELVADKESTQELLRQQGEKLVESLEASGLMLDYFTVAPHAVTAQS
ncbi:hypothetical protein MTYP_03223 [Methylophilaceae bacterium]|nr:hypothetical protein MTYP_03223 [Methylophilaceae bacterium]